MRDCMRVDEGRLVKRIVLLHLLLWLRTFLMPGEDLLKLGRVLRCRFHGAIRCRRMILSRGRFQELIRSEVGRCQGHQELLFATLLLEFSQ
jgi:hypothetical protein